jgi:hypothetical protein
MPTSPKSKQIMVTISGEVLDIFNEFKEEWDLSSDAEFFRIALKKTYKIFKEENTDLDMLKQEIGVIKKRIEELKK